MKQNKEIKENLLAEAELPKDSSKDILEKFEKEFIEENYTDIMINGFDNAFFSITGKEWNQLKSEIQQKIKELENENKKLEWAKKYLNKEIYILNPEEWKQVEQLKKFYIENNKLKSQLNSQTEKIKERIEEGNKWLKFEHGITCGNKTEVWVVKSKKDNLAIGSIRWYGKWRHYCFFPQSETVFSDRCLLAISDFVEKMNNAHKTRKVLQSLKKEVKE